MNGPKGIVVTTGGTLNGKTTAQVGQSEWGADGYNGTYPAGGKYTELEEGVTTLGSWWNANYTFKNKNTVQGVDDDPIESMLYFTVKNGRPVANVPSKTYTISFTKAGTTSSTVEDKASLTFGDATNAVDEDLIYGGNTVENAIIVKANGTTLYGGIATAIAGAAAANSWANPYGIAEAATNPGMINYDDAQYVGAVNEKNTYKASEAAVPNNSKAKAIVIEAPENFLDPAAFDTLVFTSVTPNDDDTAIYRKADLTTAATGLALSTLTQNKQSVGFTFTATDLKAWNGTQFIAANVSDTNILYAFSPKTALAPDFDPTTDEPDAIYYITVRRVADKTADQLSSVKASDAKNAVQASVNQSRKTVTISVPYSYNWIGNRSDDSADFTLDFTASNGAVLVDALRDSAFGFRTQNTAFDKKNFDLPDLVQQQQDLFAMNSEPLTYFVKGGELYVRNANTGSETQITGMGNGVNDAFINPQWGLIKAHEAELRVYPEARNNLNTYKLEVQVRAASSEAAVTRVLVDETEAVIDGTNITVNMPEGTIMSAVRL